MNNKLTRDGKLVDPQFLDNMIKNNPFTFPIAPTRKPPARHSVSVVIPTLNEAQNLHLVLPLLPLDWIDEVILIDSHSTDGTVEIARQMLPSIKVILENKLGKGVALNTGYQNANCEIIIAIDADGSHNPLELPRFIIALHEGADFVKGSRFVPGGGTADMPRIRKFGNAIFVKLVNLLFNVHFSDLCYGYHAFWRECLEIIHIDEVDGFEIDTSLYIQAARNHLRIIEVASFEGCRFRGVGKLRTFPDGWRVLKTIMREYFHSWDKSNQLHHPEIHKDTHSKEML
jgi:glycosyltransferase involved in cell wall biosynthesis